MIRTAVSQKINLVSKDEISGALRSEMLQFCLHGVFDCP